MTDSLVDVHAECQKRLGALNPSAFLSRAAYYLRGGFSGQSMSDGRGGGSHEEGFDKADKLIRQKRSAYERHLRNILTELQRLGVAESWMLEVAEALPDAPLIMCANLACPNQLEPGFTKGECGRCRTHRSRHGLAWPLKGSNVTGLRQSAVSEMLKTEGLSDAV